MCSLNLDIFIYSNYKYLLIETINMAFNSFCNDRVCDMLIKFSLATRRRETAISYHERSSPNAVPFEWSEIANENDENAMRFIKNSHSPSSLNPYYTTGCYSDSQKWDTSLLPSTIQTPIQYPRPSCTCVTVYVDNLENGKQSKAKTIVKAHAEDFMYDPYVREFQFRFVSANVVCSAVSR